jgi:hypothetical protein
MMPPESLDSVKRPGEIPEIQEKSFLNFWKMDC